MQKITISMLVIFFLTTSFSLSANDTITIAWKGNSMKNFSMASTAGKQYTINWGDGSPIQTFTGDGVFQPHYYVYGTGEYYTATISGVTPECSFTEFDFDLHYDPILGYFYNQVTELYTHLCPALQRLSCRGNLISSLDLSANTALQYLNCDENQLSNLDLHTNTALKELYCNVNQLTNLDLFIDHTINGNLHGNANKQCRYLSNYCFRW